MEQVRIDFLVTGNMSSLTGQVQGLNAQLMQSAASAAALGRSFNNMDVQAANRQFANLLTSSNQFDARMVSMKSNVDSFADGLNRARLSGRQYFTESINYMRRQSGMINELARQQVRMQNSVMQPLGRDASGKMMANVFTPTGLPDDMATRLRVTNKAWEIFNHTAQQGANSMINWGKNTQWAGRQLMVGFTVPMAMLGGLAAKTFRDLDQELVRLQKVYGSGLTFGDDFEAQAQMIRESAMKMADEMARAYGQAGTDTAALMADLASAGYEGQELMDLTRDTTKLSVLGEVDRQEAMKATVSLQTAFGHSTKEVANDVLFLNAVENQTSATLSDMVEAIPRAGTVIKGLGGDVQDLAMYMVAMREGGISAAEGANALKSGLSSIISPANEAVEFMKEFGINLPKLVTQNQGDLTGTLMAFQKELQGLDDLARQQVITKLFGKYQFARMNALFNNLGAQGSQTQEVLKLMGYSMEELGQIADQELGQKAESVSGQWDRAWETFKMNISDVGETMLKWGTTLLGFFNKIFGVINDNEWLGNLVKYGGLALAVIGPIVMTMGLLGNMFGMLTKGVLRLINFGKVMGSGGGISKSFKMLTADTFAADQALEKYNTNMFDSKKAMEVVEQAVRELQKAYEGLGLSVVETGQQMVTTMERVEAATMANATWTAGSRSNPGWKASGVPMDRAHFVPRNITDPRMQALAAEVFGFTPQPMTNPSTGKTTPSTYNFGQYGWGFTSRDANAAAGNQMPFFAQSKPNATAAQLKAAFDVNKWTEQQAILMREAGVDQAKINAWKDQTLIDAAAAAKNSKDTLAAERAYLTAMRRLAETAGIKVTQIGVDSNISTYDDRRKMVMPHGVADSPAMFDILDTQGQAAAQDLIGSVSATATAADKAKVMIDGAFQNFGVKMTPAVNKLTTQMAAAAAEIGAVSVAGITVAGQRFIAALDANGKVIQGTARFVTKEGVVRKATAEQLTLLNAAVAKDTAVMKPHTTAVIADTHAVNAAATADLKEAEASLVAAGADLKEAGASGASGGFMSRMGGMKGMGIMSAATMLPMFIPTGGNEGLNTAMNAVSGAGMGAMVGSMIAPGIGTAIGAALGGAVPLVTSAFGAMKEASDKRAAEAAANWEAEFASIDLNMAALEEMGVKADAQKTLKFDMAEVDPMKDYVARSEQVKEAFAAEIETMSKAADSVGYSQRLMAQMVAQGVDPEQARGIIYEIMKAAGKSEGFISAMSANITSIDKATKFLADNVATRLDSAFSGMPEGGRSASITAGAGKGGMYYGMQQAEREEDAVASGKAAGEAYSDGFRQAVQSGQLKSTKDVSKFYQDSLNDIVNRAAEGIDTSVFTDMNKEALSEFGITTEGKSVAQVLEEIIRLGPEAREALLRTPGQGLAGDLATRALAAEQAGIGLAGTLRDELGPEFNAIASAAYQAAGAVTAVDEALVNAQMAARAAELSSAFSSMASKFMNIPDAPEPVDLEQLERQQAREMENLQESEADRLEALQEAESERLEALQEAEAERIEAMQDAAEKRERLMQREIDQVNREYDKEIAAIERAEEKRQEAFAAEEDRFQRRQEMRNLEISYDEAVANGELYEAARIRMDIAGISKQRQRADAEERRQNRVDRRIRGIEKERRAKIRAMEKALRVEQRQNEKMIEAAQEASEAKIEAAQEASEAMIEAAQEASEKSIEAAERQNRLELKAAREKNRAIAKDEREAAQDSERLFKLLMSGRLKDFREEARELGINAKERSKLISEFVSSQFKKLPPAILKNLSDGIMQDDWSVLQKLMKGSIEGMSQQELRDLAQWQVRYNAGGSPGADASKRGVPAGYASGGYVSGPGSSTSDSIEARLSAGEYVIKASKVDQFGKGFFDRINGGHNVGRPGKGGYGFAQGGIVDPIIRSGILKPVGEGLAKMMNSLTQQVGSTGSTDSFGGLKGAGSGGIVNWDGEPVDALVAAQLRLAGKLLGHRYTVYQGSYQPQTSYSGTTHTDGGVVDTQGQSVFDDDVIALQKAGFAAWYRGPGAPGAAANYPAHIHAVSLLSRNLDTNAAYQRSHYLNMTGDGISGPYYGPHVQPIKNLRAKLPGLNTGTEFVKYDNTIANLHRGESVLTAPLTKAFKENVAGGKGDVYDIDVNGPFYKEFDVTEAVKKGILEAKREEATRNRGGRKN